LILGALMVQPGHGYAIRSYLENSLLDIWRIATSQLYNALRKLEEQNLISSRVEAQDTRPDKRTFRITGAGRERFLEWFFSPTDKVRNLRVELLAKLLFLEQLGLDGGAAMIEAQKKTLQDIKKTLEKMRSGMPVSYDALVVSQKIATVRVWLEWIESEVIPFLNEAQSNDDDLSRTEKTFLGSLPTK